MQGIDSKDEIFNGSDEEFLATLNRWHDAAKKNRQISDWKWYLYDNYYRGNHYIQFNKRTNQITTPPRPKGQVRLTVNKIYSIVRAIRNFATSYRPKWSVAATSTSENDINNNEKSAETLDNYYDFLQIPRLVKGIALHIINYGIGYFQYGYDDDKIGIDGQTGEVDVWTRDPFDVYLDPAGMDTGDIQNCRYIDIAVSKPVQDIVNNSNYAEQLKKQGIITADDVPGSTDRSASPFKDSLIKNNFLAGNDTDGDLKTTILHETLYKKKVTIEDDKSKSTDETQVWVASWIKGHLLRNEQTEFSKYNIIPIASDDNPNEIYGEGYVKNMIPINKIINRLESQCVEYNNLVNRGRIIADKNSGVSVITNETGQIIEKNAGADVRAFQPGGLSPDMNSQITRLNSYLYDISGVSDAFMGNVPVGIKAGVALESLKAQAANNLQDMKDNLETGLAQLGEGILELIANKTITSKQIQSIDKSGKPVTFKIKGQVGVEPKEKLSKDTYVIGNSNHVKVVIGSNLAYTREGRITQLDKLLDKKVIDPQTYLQALEFGDVDGIMKRTKQNQFDNAMMSNIEKNGLHGPVSGGPGEVPPPGTPPTLPTGGAMPPAGSPTGTPQENAAGGQTGGDSWTKLADDEDHAMLQGTVVPPTKDAPKMHTAIHIAWSQSDEVQQNEHLMTALLQHIKGEEAQQGAPHAQPSGTPPAVNNGGQNAS